MILRNLKTYAIAGLITVASAATAAAQITPAPSTTSYTVAYDIDGSAANQSFGNSVCNAGDVNGDGTPDLVIGARGDSTNGPSSGSVRVYSGADGTLLYAFMGGSNFDQLGHSVSCAGDVNNDGFDDLVAGAPFADNGGINSGLARVYSGIDGSVLYTFNGSAPFELLGESVSAAGDVNLDGFDDVVVGIRGNATNGLGSGAARVYSGADGTVLYNFLGDNIGDGFGNSVSGAGDVNNDGFADLVVGALGDDDNGNNAGAIRVFSGADGSILFTRFGDTAFDQLGDNVSDAGDVNRDGFDDVIVGAPSATGMAGLARIYSGADGSTLYSFGGNMANDQFGLSVSSAGDTNGDGFADVIIGSYRDGTAANSSGRAKIVSGKDGSTLAELAGDADLDYFGQTVSGAGDVNGDGFADVLVGAYADNAPAGLGAGRAALFLAPLLPVLNYKSTGSPLNTLELDWSPDGGDEQATSGTVTVTGATPNANGLYYVSVAAADIEFGGINFLVKGGPAFEVNFGGFLYDPTGSLTVPGIVRSSPGLSGQNVYIQLFESFPVIRASNGLRMLLTDII